MASVEPGHREAGQSGFAWGEMIFTLAVVTVFLAGVVVVVGDGVDRYRVRDGSASDSGEAQAVLDRLTALLDQAKAFYLEPPAGTPPEAAASGSDLLVFRGDLEGEGAGETVMVHASGPGGRSLAVDVLDGGGWRRSVLTEDLVPRTDGGGDPFFAGFLTTGEPAPSLGTASPGDLVKKVEFSVRMLSGKGSRRYSGSVSFKKPVPIERSPTPGAVTGP